MMSRNPYRVTRTRSWKAAKQVLEQDSWRLSCLPTPPEAIDAALWVWKQAWEKANGRVTVSVDEFPLTDVDLWRHAARIVYQSVGMRPAVWDTSWPYQLVP